MNDRDSASMVFTLCFVFSAYYAVSFLSQVCIFVIDSFKSKLQIVVFNLSVTSVYQTLYNMIMMGVTLAGHIMCLLSHQNIQNMFVL